MIYIYKFPKLNNNIYIPIRYVYSHLILCRYLAMGGSTKAHSMYFLRGESTTRKIIAESTTAIWECLKEQYMPVPTKEKWENVSQRFLELWNISNCLGI